MIDCSTAVAYFDTGYSVSLSAKKSEKNSIGTSSSTTVSLLDEIKTPCPSELSRKRKVYTSPPPQKKHPSLCQGDYNPNSAIPTKIACEFLSNETMYLSVNCFCKSFSSTYATPVALSIVLKIIGGKESHFDVLFVHMSIA